MDGLPILFDKSALEMLSAEKLETLCRHFFLTIPPILLVEIVMRQIELRSVLKVEANISAS